MALLPAAGAEGVLWIIVYADGEEMPTVVAASLRSVTVERMANTIPFARIVLSDGDMADESFPISDAQFKPGTPIRIDAGWSDTQSTIFEGVVMRHGLKISGANNARLVIECRDKATALTVGRKNANYV